MVPSSGSYLQKKSDPHMHIFSLILASSLGGN